MRKIFVIFGILYFVVVLIMFGNYIHRPSLEALNYCSQFEIGQIVVNKMTSEESVIVDIQPPSLIVKLDEQNFTEECSLFGVVQK